jgi:hypothetical protein
VRLECLSASATGNHVLERQPRPDFFSLRLVTPGIQGTLAAAANVTTNGVRLEPPNPGADIANIHGVLA